MLVLYIFKMLACGCSLLLYLQKNWLVNYKHVFLPGRPVDIILYINVRTMCGSTELLSVNDICPCPCPVLSSNATNNAPSVLFPSSHAQTKALHFHPLAVLSLTSGLKHILNDSQLILIFMNAKMT